MRLLHKHPITLHHSYRLQLRHSPQGSDLRTMDTDELSVKEGVDDSQLESPNADELKSKKRKVQASPEQLSEKKSTSSKRVRGIDDQAEESGDEDEGSDDGSEEEDDTNYVEDDFLVRDDANSDDDDDDDEKDGDDGSVDEVEIEKKKRLQRLKRRKDDVQLDEEDEQLIREYQASQALKTGKAVPADRETHSTKEIAPIEGRKRSNTSDSNDYGNDGDADQNDVSEGEEEQPDAADRSAASRGARNQQQRQQAYYEDEDEGSDMGGFIVDEDEDADGEQGEGGAAAAEAKARRRAAREDAVQVPHRRTGRREGPSYDQIQEAMDIFGAGFDDFDDSEGEGEDGRGFGAQGDSDGEAGEEDGQAPKEPGAAKEELSKKDQKRIQKLRSRYERSHIVATFCTENDDVLRRVDKPERLQEVLVGRETPQEEERLLEARWMAAKLAAKMIADNHLNCSRDALCLTANPLAALKSELGYLSSDSEREERLRAELQEPVANILRFLQIEMWEVPFIWAYRRDYLHPLMTKEHLWTVFRLEEDWDKTVASKMRLSDEVSALEDAAQLADHEANLNDTAKLGRLQADVRRLSVELESLRSDLRLAEAEEKQAMDRVDEKEEQGEPTDEDREKVAAASAEVEQLTERLKTDSSRLQLLRQEEAAQQARQQRRSKFSPAAAKEVMRLFPVDRYLAIVRDSSDEAELRDVLRYFRLLAQNAEAGADAEAAADDSQAPQAGDSMDMDVVDESQSPSQSQPAAPKPRKLLNKKSMRVRKDEYAKYMNSPVLRKFVETLTVPISTFGDAVRHGFKSEPPPTLDMSCEDFARQLAQASGGVFRSEEHLQKAARVVVGTEMSMEPSVRGAARGVFLRVATVSTHPTSKGLAVITPFSEYFGLQLLHRKPLADFYRGADRTLFIRLVEAERLGLITVSINVGQRRADENGNSSNEMVTDLKPFLSSDLRLMLQFLPSVPVAEDPHPEQRPSWDRERLICLQTCIEQYLCPSLQKEFRRDLIRLGKEAIVDEAARNFGKMLSVGPYVPPYQDSRERVKDLLRACPNRPFYGSVAAIYVSTGRQEPLCMAFVNKDGVLRAHDLVPAQAMNQKNDRIKKFLVENRPDLVVINASGASASRSTCLSVEKNILKEVEEEICRRDLARREGRVEGVAYADDEEELVSYKAQVMLIKDDLPKIFMNSQRSKKMFPELQPAEAAAVSLARFTQEPLAEYCGAWNSASPQEIFGYELLFLNVHPLKPLLKGAQQALLNALEYRLVDAVCEMGVDVNKACAYDHLAPLLAFVGGLGLRKADALRQNVRKGAKAVSSRNDLLLRKLLGSCVWTNAAGFLRICDNVVDPLDNSRIHPECYTTHDFATKICADALEVTHTNSDYVGNVEKLMAGVRRVLDKRMEKHKGWLDLWENGLRPVQGVTVYNETVRTADGVEHPLSVELGDILSQLELDDYAVELEESGQGKRRLLFEQIKEELRFPCLDLRLPLAPLSASDMFFLLTGETDQSLYVGLRVGGTITEISDTAYLDERTNDYKRRQRATVQTDAGLRGFISVYDVLDSSPHERINFDDINLADKLKVGQHVEAVVVGVKKDKLQLDLSIKPSLLSKPESWWMQERHEQRQAREWWEMQGKNPSKLFDRYFLESEALKLCSEEESAQRKSSESINQQLTAASLSGARSGSGPSGAGGGASGGRSIMRVVHHPLFANLDFKAAEERMRLEGKGAGEVLIRPSSKGVNFLTITWAFQDNWYKHISVEEKGKRAGDLGLGTQLYVQEDDMHEPYNDLDELFSRYIEPMNDLVSVMVKHRSFMRGTEAEVNAMMFAKRAESPQRIPYFFRFEPNKPGMFTLTWLSLNMRSESPVKTLRVEVRPYGLRAQGETFVRPSDLVVWFKATQEAQAAAQVAANSLAKQKARAGASATPSVSASMPLPPPLHHAPPPADQARRSRFHN